MGQPLDVFEDLSISMTMVPGHSVKRVGLSPLCKYDGQTTYPLQNWKKREGLS